MEGFEEALSEGEGLTQEDEQTRRSFVDTFLKRNNERRDWLLENYQKASGGSSGYSYEAVSVMFLETYKVMNQFRESCIRKEEKELAEKYELIIERMEELGDQDDIVQEVMRNMLKSAPGHTRGQLKSIVENHGVQMLLYADRFFEGTDLAKEGEESNDDYSA